MKRAVDTNRCVFASELLGENLTHRKNCSIVNNVFFGEGLCYCVDQSIHLIGRCCRHGHKLFMTPANSTAGSRIPWQQHRPFDIYVGWWISRATFQQTSASQAVEVFERCCPPFNSNFRSLGLWFQQPDFVEELRVLIVEAALVVGSIIKKGVHASEKQFTCAHSGTCRSSFQHPWVFRIHWANGPTNPAYPS